MAEVMSGRVDFFFGPVGLILPLVREGKLTALVAKGAKRSAELADVPTTSEQVMPMPTIRSGSAFLRRPRRRETLSRSSIARPVRRWMLPKCATS